MYEKTDDSVPTCTAEVDTNRRQDCTPWPALPRIELSEVHHVASMLLTPTEKRELPLASAPLAPSSVTLVAPVAGELAARTLLGSGPSNVNAAVNESTAGQPAVTAAPRALRTPLAALHRSDESAVHTVVSVRVAPRRPPKKL
jgi:hypothetical protein